MDKLYSFFENLYSSDSKFMLYIYVGIAVITILLILIIIFSSIGNLISRNKQKKLEKKETDALANKNSQVIPVIPESQNQKELVAEKIVNKDNNTEVKSDLLNSKDLKLELESDQINIKEIQPIPDELLSKEIASIPEKESLDLTRPIPRVN
ncbi:MAG: hypothetical protein PHF21_03580, partial [Bacilli bacterium]|nr:hypothetical protein [Bacilli bacterium]